MAIQLDRFGSNDLTLVELLSGLVSTLVINTVNSAPPVITGLGLYDLGTAGTNDLSNTHGVRLPCKVDVSRDGTLVGATDGSGNAFIWTPANGKVTLGSGMKFTAGCEG